MAAEAAIAKLGEGFDPQLVVVECEHSKTATITDRLFGRYENLLVLSADGEVNFFCADSSLPPVLHKEFGGWYGTGFWGGYPDQAAVKARIQELVRA